MQQPSYLLRRQVDPHHLYISLHLIKIWLELTWFILTYLDLLRVVASSFCLMRFPSLSHAFSHAFPTLKCRARREPLRMATSSLWEASHQLATSEGRCIPGAFIILQCFTQCFTMMFTGSWISMNYIWINMNLLDAYDTMYAYIYVYIYTNDLVDVPFCAQKWFTCKWKDSNVV